MAVRGVWLHVAVGDCESPGAVGEDGCVVVTDGDASGSGASVMIRVDDADAHCRRETQHGADIVRPPADQPYGERQYNALDFAGRY